MKVEDFLMTVKMKLSKGHPGVTHRQPENHEMSGYSETNRVER